MSEAHMASREGELQLLRDLQRIVHQIYMREMERTFLFAGVGRVAVDELIRFGMGPTEHQLIADRVLQPELWETILPATHRTPQRLPQLTAPELLAVVPPAIRRTLEALGLPEVAAAELQRMLEPNNEAAEGADGGQQVPLVDRLVHDKRLLEGGGPLHEQGHANAVLLNWYYRLRSRSNDSLPSSF